MRRQCSLAAGFKFIYYHHLSVYIYRYYWILKLHIYTYVCINDLCTTLPVQSLDEHPAASIHSSSTAKLLSIAFEFCFQSHKICIPATILYTSATKTPFGSSTKAPPSTRILLLSVVAIVKLWPISDPVFIHFSSLYFYGGLHIECRQSTRYLHDDILGIQQQQQQQEKFGILKFMAFDLFCVFRFYYTRSIPPPPTKTYYCSSCEMFRKMDDFIYNIFTTRFYLNQLPNPPPS